MKRLDQILITPINVRRDNGDFYCGYAPCPCCGEESEVIIPKRKSLAVLGDSCPHADMAVDAGTGEIAVQFIWISSIRASASERFNRLEKEEG